MWCGALVCHAAGDDRPAYVPGSSAGSVRGVLLLLCAALCSGALPSSHKLTTATHDATLNAGPLRRPQAPVTPLMQRPQRRFAAPVCLRQTRLALACALSLSTAYLT